jgi:hypothetical protein
MSYRARTFWWNLREQARRLFAGERNPQQLPDLVAEMREFCGADTVPLRVDNTGRTDHFQTGIMVGRLEVWKKLEQILSLTDVQIAALPQEGDE